MKSMARWDQGLWGEGSDMSLPASRARSTLAWAQAEQEETNSLMSVNMFFHQYFVLGSWYVRWLLGCPMAGDECAKVKGGPGITVGQTLDLEGMLLGGCEAELETILCLFPR